MRVKRSLAVAAMLVTVAASTAAGAVKTREIEYKQEGSGTPLKGMIAWDDAKSGKRPGVLVVHEWWGMNDRMRDVARHLAEAGYVGLALDVIRVVHREAVEGRVANRDRRRAVQAPGVVSP